MVKYWIYSTWPLDPTPKHIRSRVQKLPAWYTKAAPNGKCCKGYIALSMVRLMYQIQACWNKGRLCWKIANLFYFCHLKRLVRAETFGPYYINTIHVLTNYFLQIHFNNIIKGLLYLLILDEHYICIPHKYYTPLVFILSWFNYSSHVLYRMRVIPFHYTVWFSSLSLFLS